MKSLDIGIWQKAEEEYMAERRWKIGRASFDESVDRLQIVERGILYVKL